ncbi:MAG: hypothetical protein MZV49_15055 [Rhodopseudomonas palustris]|nr:hypothetical protein [Rhodopseudomonas palustris]
MILSAASPISIRSPASGSMSPRSARSACSLLALILGLVIIAVLVFMVGAFLLWIPVVGLLLAAGLVAGVLRPYLQKRG